MSAAASMVSASLPLPDLYARVQTSCSGHGVASLRQ